MQEVTAEEQSIIAREVRKAFDIDGPITNVRRDERSGVLTFEVPLPDGLVSDS